MTRTLLIAVSLIATAATPARSSEATTGALSPLPSAIVAVRSNEGAAPETIEEFIERCAVPVRSIFVDERVPAPRPSDIVFAIGDRAAAIASSTDRLIVAFTTAEFGPALRADPPPSPERLLRGLIAGQPRVRRVGIVFGQRTQPLATAAAAIATSLGLTTVPIRASDGPEAIRLLRRAATSIDAIWLTPDPDVHTAQLFQYALTLQLRNALPVIGATRQQVRSGALLAVEVDPRDVGRRAAAIATRLLAGDRDGAERIARTGQPSRLIANREIGRLLGVDLAALRRLGASVE